jgi:hypothetical protein
LELQLDGKGNFRFFQTPFQILWQKVHNFVQINKLCIILKNASAFGKMQKSKLAKNFDKFGH